MINEFVGPYAFLSNFYEFNPPIRVDYFRNDCFGVGSITVNSSEVAYQAGKSINPKMYESLTPMQSKRKGRRETICVAKQQVWDEQYKLPLMRRILKLKFDSNHPELQKALLDTGSEELIEGNYWHDNYWGICSCGECKGGENNLGKLLMEIREELKNERSK